MNAMKCIVLKDNDSILNLSVGNAYLGKIENNYVILNKRIKIPFNKINFDFSKYEKDQVAIIVKKIILPNEIIADAEDISKYEILENLRNNNDFVKIKDIENSLIGKIVFVEGIVEKIIQTNGPTLFKIRDETGVIITKAFAGVGKRAFQEIKEGDGVSAKIKISMYDNNIEGEIISMKKSDFDYDAISKRINEQSIPSKDYFSIYSSVYENMKELFISAATRIKKAIYEQRPILLRHHADCDGYSGALAIEHSIIAVMKEIYKDEKMIWTHYSRIPNRTPFYDYSEASKDVAFFLDDMIRFGNKAPLIICLDFGSSNESLLSYKKLKMFGSEIIVVDHHLSSFEEFENVKNYVDVFINPHEHLGNEKITAGMLGYELSLFIKEHNLKHLPIISGFGDRSDGYEFLEYCKNFSEEELKFYKKLADVVDFEAYHLKFLEGRSYFNELLTNKEFQEKIVEEIHKVLEELWNEYDSIIKKNMKIIKEKPLIIMLEDISIMNDFPSPGKITGFAKDQIIKRTNRTDVVVIYVFDDGIVLRSEDFDLEINKRVKQLQEKFPEFLVEGGGHSKAGSIRFLKIGKNKILEEVLNWFKD
ncbi:MAG: hypothetical protein QXS41_02040 [Candidatus Woesearchaeota archaeon]